MPDAVIDIWKNRVEYWGYTYEQYFSLPNSVTISHNNVGVDGRPLY
ncbi:hypothetical protein [Hathewaya proteolytica]|nr:hypothetical protein [Hathewaya proteolytica]